MRTRNATLFVRFCISVYRPWRVEYDKFVKAHARMGVLSYCIYQAADNPIDVTMVYEFADANIAYAFIETQEFKTAMQNAGVTSSEIWVTHIVGCNTWETLETRGL